jgi:DNA-binding NarL/FixJ family response regulator
MEMHPNPQETISRRELASEPFVILSPREKQLLRRLAKGKTDHRIALEIGGTHRQIGLQRQRLIARLGIRSHAQLVKLADQFAPWPEHRDGRR